MTDRISKERRSWNMSRIRSKDTAPEVRVRSFLHRAGYRFRLHDKSLPGSPDIVLRKHRTAIFVHGCYWHRHPGCKDASTPKTRVDFWQEKFRGNVLRDEKNTKSLEGLGWNVEIIWECQTKKDETLRDCIDRILSKGNKKNSPVLKI